MAEEVQNWWKQAENDLKAAKVSAAGKIYDWACFQSQQAVEKALKAIYLKEFKDLIKVHDLVFLSRRLALPQEIEDSCIKLNKVYIPTRYPEDGTSSEKFSAQDAQQCIEIASNLLTWLQKKL